MVQLNTCQESTWRGRKTYFCENHRFGSFSYSIFPVLKRNSLAPIFSCITIFMNNCVMVEEMGYFKFPIVYNFLKKSNLTGRYLNFFLSSKRKKFHFEMYCK